MQYALHYAVILEYVISQPLLEGTWIETPAFVDKTSNHLWFE